MGWLGSSRKILNKMISIIIPVYNAQDTLSEAIESALLSGLPSQEIIIVDDGSTDKSWDIISKFKSLHNSILVHRSDFNLGGGAARNIGISLATQPYIFPLDSDDILIRGALPRALQEIQSLGVDCLAAGKSIFFTKSVYIKDFEINYSEGQLTFMDLVSTKANPAIGNLLFTRTSFQDVGGYPEHHGFDTQGFGFRLLASGKKVYVANFPFYYQRLPSKPSYYIRELRAGNVNRNWFFIFIECLYKFSPKVRADILSFPYSEPRQLARGQHLFHELANRAEHEDIYCLESLSLSPKEAYSQYDQSLSPELQIWCLCEDLKMGNISKGLGRIKRVQTTPGAVRAIYPFLSQYMTGQFNSNYLDDFYYFFGKKKPLTWKLGFYGQKILNRFGLGWL